MRQKLQNVRKGAFRRRRVILAPIVVPAILAAILALKVTEMIIKAFWCGEESVSEKTLRG